ncbi:hypothetical protein QCA50_007117 [Cerrena zonata]
MLSPNKDDAVQELAYIRRFIATQHPASLTLHVHHNLRPEIVSLLQSSDIRKFQLYSSVLGFQPGIRRHPEHHFETGLWHSLTSFTAQSPCMFTAVGQRIIRAIAQGDSINHLCLSHTTIANRTWVDLLSKLTVPKLSRFEIEGRVTLKSLGAFLSRHNSVEDLRIGSSIRTPNRCVETLSLPILSCLHAPGRSALPFLRGSRVIRELDIAFDDDSSKSAHAFREFLKRLPETQVTHINLDVGPQSLLVLSEDHVSSDLRNIVYLGISLHSIEFPTPSLMNFRSKLATLPILKSLNFSEFFKTPNDEPLLRRDQRRQGHEEYLVTLYRHRRESGFDGLRLSYYSQMETLGCDEEGKILTSM